MKTCRQCGKEKPLEEFNINCSKTGRLRPYCKFCDSLRSKRDYYNNKDHKKRIMKEWREKNNYVAPGNYLANPIKGVYGMFRNGICYYIGSSKNVYRRRSAWVVKNSHIKLDMSKYIWGIIEECDNYLEREKYYISVYQPKYNNHK
jgi:hypothetical protein